MKSELVLHAGGCGAVWICAYVYVGWWVRVCDTITSHPSTLTLVLTLALTLTRTRTRTPR